MSQVEVFENERATNYDSFVRNWIPNYDYFVSILPHLLSGTPNKNLMVVGCGTGNEIEAFAKSTQGWKITGIDPSPEMVAQAREKLTGQTGIKLVDGLVFDLSPKTLFGAATLLLVLHFLKDDGAKLELLKDIASKLEKGAPFVLLDITGSQKQLEENLKILWALLPTDIAQEDKRERLERIQSQLHYISESRLIDLLIEAGFKEPNRFFQTTVYMGWLTNKNG